MGLSFRGLTNSLTYPHCEFRSQESWGLAHIEVVQCVSWPLVVQKPMLQLYWNRRQPKNIPNELSATESTVQQSAMLAGYQRNRAPWSIGLFDAFKLFLRSQAPTALNISDPFYQVRSF